MKSKRMNDFDYESMLEGINPATAREIELFLINCNLDRAQKMKVIEFVNRAYVQGERNNPTAEEIKEISEDMDKSAIKYYPDITD